MSGLLATLRAMARSGHRAAGRLAGRLAERSGLAEQPSAVRRLFAFGVSGMLTAIGVGLAFAVTDGVPAAAHWLVVAAVVAALSQIFTLRVRAAGPGFSLGWGETALIFSLYAIPAGWIPGVIGVGAVGGHLWLLASGRHRTLADAIRNAAAITVAGTAGVLVAGAVATNYHARLTPMVALALCLGAAAYFAVTAAFASALAVGRGQGTFRASFTQLVRNKALMFVGNVVTGIGIAAMLAADWRWVLLLPPVLWLLQQTYSHQLRADEERRIWQAFAVATRALNQLDERGVALAGVEGAMSLFSPRQAEVAACMADGVWHRYLAVRGGPVTEATRAPNGCHPAGPQPDGHEPGNDGVRELSVGGASIGQLRLSFDDPATLTARQQAVLSSFADALAAALHDAATHRQLQAITARSSYDAEHDPLTGLPNRATVLDRGDEALQRLDPDQPVALLLLDVDHFKEVNDTLGHAAGDDLLRTTAARLGQVAGPDALVARLGGDEFALLLTRPPDDPGQRPDDETTRAETATRTPLPSDSARAPLRLTLRFARQLAEHLAAPTEVAGVQLSVEVSIGVVVATAARADMSELLRRADIAMYQAKRGGASVAWYDSAKDAASTDRLALLAELREALAAADQLVVELQPAVDLRSGGPTGVEALVRWRHPRRGLLRPVDFVRAVEDSELLGAFTRRVLDLALGHAARWADSGVDVPVAANISPRNLLDPTLPADIAELLRRHGVPAHRLVLEITETVVLAELEIIDEVLAGLRALGVQLAVDDFGTGYSSLTFLTRIAVDEVKVDRGFVARMVDSPEAAAIVRTTVHLGRELGLRVVAEGVETAEQRRLLTAMGCSAAQGFHFFPPMPAEQIGAVLSTLSAAAALRVIPLRADGVS